MSTANYRLTLSKDEITGLPVTSYDGRIYLVDSEDKLDEALDALKNDTLLGLDTEMRPTFGKGKTLHPTALLQLCGADAAVLIRTQPVPITGRLKDILENPDVIKVGVAIGDDMRLLRRNADFSAAGLIDLAQSARLAGIQTLGLRSLAANFLGVRISKGAQCSNWENPQLTPQQIVYAATDAWIGREIYLKMKEAAELTFEPAYVTEPFAPKSRKRYRHRDLVSKKPRSIESETV